MIKSLEPVNINGVGLDNVEKSIESKLSVFPNPVRNKANVHIEADGYKKVVIYSVDGEVMRIIDEFTDNELYLDISRYTPGIYFIYVKDVDNNQYITKILKL
jgi:predicted RNA-binding protein associated with RNAse of E/G family